MPGMNQGAGGMQGGMPGGHPGGGMQGGHPGGGMPGDSTAAPGQTKGHAASPQTSSVINPQEKVKRAEDAATGGLFSADDPIARGPEYGYNRVRLHKNEEVSIYAQETDERHAMDPRKRACLLMIPVLIVCYIVAIILPDQAFSEYHFEMTPALWVQALTTNINQITDFITGQSYVGVIDFKIYQYIIVALAGAGLAVTGAMFQGSLKNAMAAPSTLGVTSGAQLGVVLYVLLGGSVTAISTATSASTLQRYYEQMSIPEYIWETEASSLCALAGSFVIVMLVLLIAHIAGRGKVSKSALIIAGSVFATVISAIVQLIRYWIVNYGTEDQLTAVTGMATGTLSGTCSLLDVALVGIPVVICIVILMRLRTRMNLLSFTDEEAKSMGMSPQLSRNLTIAVCTVLTAVITAFCGMIGFVGFLVPHATRKLVGPDFNYLVPGSMLVGAIFAVLSNMFTNMALGGLGMGSVTGIIGCVFFIVTMLRQRRSGNADWV